MHVLCYYTLDLNVSILQLTQTFVVRLEESCRTGTFVWPNMNKITFAPDIFVFALWSKHGNNMGISNFLVTSSDESSVKEWKLFHLTKIRTQILVCVLATLQLRYKESCKLVTSVSSGVRQSKMDLRWTVKSSIRKSWNRYRHSSVKKPDSISHTVCFAVQHKPFTLSNARTFRLSSRELSKSRE